MTKPLRLAQIGTGWISTTHMDSYRAIAERVGGIEVVVAWGHRDYSASGKQFCSDYSIPEFTSDWQETVKRKDIDVVTVATPNYLHGQVALAALKAGKHIIVEKPLTVSLEEAEEIVELSKKLGLVVGYGEELCYLPKFIRMKQIADSGALGDVYMIKQCEKHAGPYSPWFWRRDEAGGGILMDMGCHAIEFCRWAAGKKAAKKVTALMNTFLHKDKTQLEDHVILTVEFVDGTLAQIESSWALKGGMDSIAEIYGTKGVIYGDLLHGMGLKCFSETGYMPMPNNQAQTGGIDSIGWSMPDYEWLWNNGYPQEMADFLTCVRKGGTPVESASDGLAVLEIMTAGYHSAGTGKTVALPFRPAGVERPVDLWLKPRTDL